MQQERTEITNRLAQHEREVEQAVDPNRFWNSRTTGQKVLAAIAIAFGGFSRDGQNHALKIINKAIANDIAAQKANEDIRLRDRALDIKGDQVRNDRIKLALSAKGEPVPPSIRALEEQAKGLTNALQVAKNQFAKSPNNPQDRS